jgi:hypothetical protein
LQSRIGHLHIKYRVPRILPSASLLVPALERIAHDQIGAVCDQAFAETFVGDPTVYVIRRVDFRVAVVSRPEILESLIATQWGRRLCAAVVESLRREDGGNVVSFENQADFISAFLTELTTGDAWSKWYFGAFDSYREFERGEASLAVLEDNREWFLETFRRLREKNSLEVVLSYLTVEEQQRLWKGIAGSAPEEPKEAFQVFIRSALDVLDALQLWSAERPSEHVLLESYLATSPPTPLWTNTGSLADAVADVIQFIISRHIESAIAPLQVDQITRLEKLFSSRFDWLDVAHLLKRVLLIFQTTTAMQGQKQFVLRPVAPSTEQKRLLEQIVRLVRAGECQLDLRDDNPHANLVRLLVRLSQASDSSSVVSITTLLESIIAAWIALRHRADSRQILAALRHRSVLSVGGKVEQTSPGDIAAHLQVVGSSGEPAIALVEELLNKSKTSDECDFVVQTECAGLFLLVRAIQDVRLKTTLYESGFESLESLLTGLAICLGGDSVSRNDALEEGAALWAGIESKDSIAKLELLHSLDCERFEKSFDELLAAQRADTPAGDLKSGDQLAAVPCSEAVRSLLQTTSIKLLHAWACWLPGFSNSSAPFLLEKFIRRSGAIGVSSTFLEVRLQHGPLDMVLQMAGYLEETPAAQWLGNRRVRFQSE